MRLYVPRSFDRLLGMEGFSAGMLKDHLTLYAGYVANANKLAAALAAFAEKGATESPESAELTRRFAWEFNGMRLHELYFENLTKTPKPPDRSARLRRKITADFGSFARWAADFRAKGLMRGIGWIILTHDPLGNRLHNAWINEHDEGHLAGGAPLLVMDVFEHAYMRDYGLKRNEYVDAFFRYIDWKVVAGRLKREGMA